MFSQNAGNAISETQILKNLGSAIFRGSMPPDTPGRVCPQFRHWLAPPPPKKKNTKKTLLDPPLWHLLLITTNSAIHLLNSRNPPEFQKCIHCVYVVL